MQTVYRHRLPSTVYRLSSTVYHLPSTVYRLPSTVYHLPSTIYRLPSTVYCLPSAVYRLLPVYRLPFTIHRLPSTVYNPPSTVYNPLSTVPSSTLSERTSRSISRFRAIHPFTGLEDQELQGPFRAESPLPPLTPSIVLSETPSLEDLNAIEQNNPVGGDRDSGTSPATSGSQNDFDSKRLHITGEKVVSTRLSRGGFNRIEYGELCVEEAASRGPNRGSANKTGRHNQTGGGFNGTR